MLIEVCTQNKFAIFSSPKTILLLPVVILPPGLPVTPASLPNNKLLVPVVTLVPASFPSAVLLFPVVTANNVSLPTHVLKLPVV